MNVKLIGLGLIAIMLIALFVQLQPEREEATTRLVFPDLQSGLEAVTGIEVMRLGAADGLSITRSDGAWTLAERAGYPADFGVLSGFLRALAELRIAETKTAKAENHGRLGLAREGDDAGLSVTLRPGARQLIIGAAARSGGAFIRFPEDDQVYLTAQTIEVPEAVIDWVDPVAINVESEEVQKVVIETSTRQFVRVERDAESGNFTLLDMPEGRELKYDTITDSLSRLLLNVRFLDVARYDPALFDEPSRATVTLKSGEAIAALTVQAGEDYWLHVAREGAGDWQYRISEYTFDEFNKTMADMLQAPEEE